MSLVKAFWKMNSRLSDAELDYCNWMLCTCDVACACANWVKHVNYLWMQFADASFKKGGIFWSEFSTQCGKLSPTQSTEEPGCWTDCFPAFFSAKKLGECFVLLLRILQISSKGIFPLLLNLSCSKHLSSSWVLQGTVALFPSVAAICPLL